MALAAALVALAIPAISQLSAPPGVYTLEPKPTRVLFAVSRFGLTTYRGEFIGT